MIGDLSPATLHPQCRAHFQLSDRWRISGVVPSGFDFGWYSRPKMPQNQVRTCQKHG